MNPVAAEARSGAVALPDWAENGHGRPGRNRSTPECDRAHDDPDLPRAVVDEVAESIGVRGRGTDREPGHGDSESLHLFVDRAGRLLARIGKTLSPQDDDRRHSRSNGAGRISLVDGSDKPYDRSGRDRYSRYGIEIDRDARGPVLDEPGAAGFERSKVGGQGAFDRY